MAAVSTDKKAPSTAASSGTTSPSSSTRSSSADLQGLNKTAAPPSSRERKSLQDRSKIPYSMYVIYGSIFGLEYSSGMWTTKTLTSWYASMTESAATFYEWMGYTRDLTQSAVEGEYHPWKEYAKTGVIFLFGLSLFYVFIVAPLMAGFWTGPKTRKHKFHRYAGLLYLVQYFFAWVEYMTNYTDGAAASYLPHFIAFNGTSS